MAVSEYLGRITDKFNQQPDYMAFVQMVCQGPSDTVDQVRMLPFLLDLDFAVGDQLDIIGGLVGASRDLPAPLPGSGITVLADPDFQQLVRAVIAQNHWDGTTPGIYAIWEQVFGGTFKVMVQDYQDMSMAIIVFATTFSNVALAMLDEGYFDLRPAGVEMLGFFQPSVPGTPVFGWGLDTVNVQGWGLGSWIEPLQT